jgi:hypothetical protein
MMMMVVFTIMVIPAVTTIIEVILPVRYEYTCMYIFIFDGPENVCQNVIG